MGRVFSGPGPFLIRGWDVSAAIKIRQDFDAPTVRRLATTVKDAHQARRLLALAAIYDGKDREEAGASAASIARRCAIGCTALIRAARTA